MVATAGQCLALTGDELARLIIAYIAVGVGLIATIWAATVLDPSTVTWIAAFTGSVAGLLAWGAIRADQRGSAALLMSVAGMAFVSLYSPVLIRGTTDLL